MRNEDKNLLLKKLDAIHNISFSVWETSLQKIVESKNNTTHVELTEELDINEYYNDCNLPGPYHKELYKGKNDNYETLYFYEINDEEFAYVYSFNRLLTEDEYAMLIDVTYYDGDMLLTKTKEYLK